MTTSSALITGAASGVGAALAKIACAEFDHLYLLDLNLEGLALLATHLRDECSFVRFTLLHGSVASSDYIDDVFRQIDGSDQTLLAVFHCASILRGDGGLVMASEMPDTDWENIIDVNLTGAFIVSKFALRTFATFKTHGDIILFGSSSATAAPALDAAYAASKAGVVALADSLNDEVMRSGIRVQCISPDAVDTPIWDQNFNVLPRPPHMISAESVADIALRMTKLPRDAYVRNLQVYPIKKRKSKRA